jgi:nucleoside recognition membrane protein YjiH
MLTGKTKKEGARSLLRFLIPSALGAFFFLLPVRYEGGWTIPMGALSALLTESVGEYMPFAVLAIVVVSALLSVWYSLIKRPPQNGYSGLQRIFFVSRNWLLLRLAGMVTTILIFFRLGPEFIWGNTTGHVVLYELATAIVTIFIFASLLLPLLTDFGLMELIGTVFRNVFRKLFRLPGRSCIDAVASWMAAAPVGVLITSQQYDRGFYSGREAATIATNFSVVSLPFCLVVAQFTGLGHLFFPYYMTVVVAGLITAMILPRIPPLSRKKDQYSEAGKQITEEVPQGDSLFRWGLGKAIAKAESAPAPGAYLRTSIEVLFDIWFGLMSPLMLIATLGLILVEYTPVMTWLSYPLIPVLDLLRLPEAAAAAPALLVGFAEMFLPAVLAKGIESELTRFVVISVSITQLIYMSEVGILILKTRIPLNFLDLVVVFLLRTLISLPIIAAIAHWVVF